MYLYVKGRSSRKLFTLPTVQFEHVEDDQCLNSVFDLDVLAKEMQEISSATIEFNKIKLNQ